MEEDAEIYARQINNAIKSDPINEKDIVNILCNTTSGERLQIRAKYKELFHHPIQDDFTSDLSYKFKDLCRNMFDSQYEYDARELHGAFHNFLNDDKCIVEILATRPKEHLDIVNQVYRLFYKISLRDDIKNECSREYASFLLAIMDTKRPEDPTISEEEAYNIAKIIKKREVKNYGKEIALFKSIFLEKSRDDLIHIARAYNEQNNESLYDAIKNEVGGKNKKILKAILFYTISPSEYFSRKAHKAMRGLGTDFPQLCRSLLYRSEIDMSALRYYYKKFRNTSLREDIIKDCGEGSYGQVLANLSLK